MSNNIVQIQPVAFTLHPDLTRVLPPLYSLSFPPTWEGPLRALQAQATGREGKPVRIPFQPINHVLEALVPYLLTAPRYPRRVDPKDERAEPQPWLIAREPIPPIKLWMVFQAWLEQTFSQNSSTTHDGQHFAQVKALLKSEALQWKPLTLPLDLESKAANGTARLPSLAYSILPSMLADRLIEGNVKVPIFGELRQLRRVPTKQGAELVTWPPVEYKNDNGAWPYSYFITFTLQTLAGNPQPRLHVHVGVRRWINRSMIRDGRFVMRRRASVYLHTTRPWMGLELPQAFTVAHLEAYYDSDKRLPRWGDKIPSIAQRLNVRVPDAQMLAEDPMRWLYGVDGVVAAVAYKTPRFHPVRAGVDFEIREQLTTIIKEALSAELTLCPPLERLKGVVNVAKPALSKNDLRELSKEERLTAWAASVGSNATIEVWWQTERGRDMLVDRVLALLCRDRPGLVDAPAATKSALQLSLWDDKPPVTSGSKQPRVREEEPLPEAVTEPVEISLPENGHIRIVPRPLGELGALFPAPRNKQGKLFGWARTHYRRTEIEKRAQAVVKAVGKTSEPTLVLVELANFKATRQTSNILRDPKLALRLGFARGGRVSQFTTGAIGIDSLDDVSKQNADLRQRCENAVLDGLRHLGYVSGPLKFQPRHGRALPEELLVAAVWVVRLTRKRGMSKVYLPVVVLTHIQHSHVLAWLPDGKGTRSYRQALLDITTIPPEEVQRTRQSAMLNELSQFLEDLAASNNMVILAVAQNARLTWPGLSNERLALDAIQWDRKGKAIPVDHFAGKLRLIRLRTSRSNETPDWYEPNQTRKSGFRQGIWKEPDTPRLFYNIAAKPKTMKNSGGRGKQRDPTEYVAIPSLLEIQVAALPANEKEHADTWALAIDQWRRMGFLSSDMTLLPMPQAWAHKMEEYARVIGPWLLNEWEEDEDEEDEEKLGSESLQLSFDFDSLFTNKQA